MEHVDIAVVGAGLAGSLAALALADSGRRVALIAPKATHADGRTTALMEHSIRFIRDLGLWDELVSQTASLATMRIVDGTERLLRAPVVTFHASEIGLTAFGYNIPNTAFLDLLDRQIRQQSGLRRLETTLDALMLDNEKAILTLGDGTVISADLVVGADGRRSKVREAAGVDVRTWSYPQTAIVLNFSHSLPHQNISTEFHTPDGPFTQVPLPGQRSSLVWVRKPADAEATLALASDALSRTVEDQMQSMLGKVSVEPGVQSFPLSGMTAHAFGKNRVVLLGEAAHAFPPIGAQGLNLSLRDAMTLVSLLGENSGKSIPADFGNRYNRKRRADILTRTASVDLLNRSLLSDFLPTQLLRAAGLQVLASAGPLRNLVMREGLHPGSALRAFGQSLREWISRQRA
ncbi:2-octaprenyl-6-methoxyphenol hydroxylase [Pararhizobium capsulatum DSM 1112]|uniref:2-octaprenyl-6-methoxyphenol hydroxylase n=1 Tax=Pararhizobium capsulatum DSM 1112 TaxID=1121113 RepID=A0ABU0BTV5_9HYPH|nr:UbiH/UbiF family hydroxylase [Pararhizobium capsulatum]MDQ0320287.1 2-octaprenyl-6-methoxyphenol hydroxylase [Pararhizobium capsulatum DSM 1112]